MPVAQVVRKGERLRVAQSVGGCRANAAIVPHRNPGTALTAGNAFITHWFASSACTVPVPVFVTLATLMHEPRGQTHGDAASGLNVADIANVAYGGGHVEPAHDDQLDPARRVPVLGRSGQLRRRRHQLGHLRLPNVRSGGAVAA